MNRHLHRLSDTSHLTASDGLLVAAQFPYSCGRLRILRCDVQGVLAQVRPPAREECGIGIYLLDRAGFGCPWQRDIEGVGGPGLSPRQHEGGVTVFERDRDPWVCPGGKALSLIHISEPTRQ